MNIIKKLWGMLLNNPFWKSVAALSSGQIIAQAINLITMPIISRIYSKGSYGDFGIVVSTATIFIGFIGLGLSSAIMLAKDDKDSKKIFAVCYGIQFILATLIAAVMMIMEPYHKLFDTQVPYKVAVLIMYLYILFYVMSSMMHIYINRMKMNKVLFINPLISALAAIFITIPLGMLGFDAFGLYVANLLSMLLADIHMIRSANPFYGIPKLKDFIYVIKEYKRFIIYQYPANLMGIFTGQMPNQFMSGNFGNNALGDYAMCNKLFGLPMHLIATPIQTIYFRTASQKAQEGENIADFTFSLITKLMLIAFIPIVILMGFGEELFKFVFGPQWGIAGTMAAILALQYVFSFCQNCVVYCRVCINKQNINLLISIIQLIVIIGSLLVGVLVFKSSIGLVTCFAVANLLYSAFNMTVNFYCMKKHTLKFIIFSVVYCIAALLLTALIKVII